jgi:hypothetical protein
LPITARNCLAFCKSDALKLTIKICDNGNYGGAGCKKLRLIFRKAVTFYKIRVDEWERGREERGRERGEAGLLVVEFLDFGGGLDVGDGEL